MNEIIVQFIKKTITSKGIKYAYLSNEAKIDYQRLMRIFNQNAVITGTELLKISKVLGISHDTLMSLIQEKQITNVS